MTCGQGIPFDQALDFPGIVRACIGIPAMLILVLVACLLLLSFVKDLLHTVFHVCENTQVGWWQRWNETVARLKRALTAKMLEEIPAFQILVELERAEGWL